MNRFIDFLKVSNTLDSNKLPDFGQIDIPDYERFLEKSKKEFFDQWEILIEENKQHVKLKDKGTSLKDFEKLILIGTGTFGKVYLVKSQKGEYHAMKAVLKKTVVNRNQVCNVITEKFILQCTNCPFHVRLNYCFKDNSYLYFILPFIQGGELYRHLLSVGKFDELSVMFYVAQVILALEYLHNLNIVYRDLKPENILLDHTGYVKLTDFGFCKRLRHESQRTYTFCGTLDYLAPEVVLNEGYGKAVDWWAVGVLLYELAVGVPPFEEKNEQRKLKKIVQAKIRFPRFMSLKLKQLLLQTLQKDLTRRYGNLKNGVNDFKTHAWFRPLNWQAVICRKAEPPFIPEIDGPTDLRQINKIDHQSLVIASNLEYGKEFADF